MAASAGLGELSADAWDATVAPGQGPLRYGYLAAWQHAVLPRLRMRPLVVEDESGAVRAAAPGFLYDLDVATVHIPWVDRIVQQARRVAPRLLTIPVYEVAASAPLVPPFAVVPGEDRAAAVDVLVEEARVAAHSGSARMVIVHSFERMPGTEGDAFQRHGFQQVPIPPTAIMPLPHRSFDDYLGAMRSQYRRRARKVLERSSHLHAELVSDFSGEAATLARMWRLVYDRAGEVKREILPEAYFRAAAGLDYVNALVLSRPDGSMASFALLLDDAPWLHWLFCGFEEEAARREGAYFRLIYEIVRNGIDRGFDVLNLGITTLEPKVDAGAIPVPLHAWIHHRNPTLQRAFAHLAAGAFAPRQVEARNVFQTA